MGMMAWSVELQKGVSLFTGIPITPAFPFSHGTLRAAYDYAQKPPNSVRVEERSHGVATGRERLVEKFLAGDWTHFLFLDADILIKPDTITKMIELDKPVVVGRYHETGGRRLPEVFRHSRVPFRRDNPIEYKANEIFEFPQPAGDVLLCGLGLIMLKREVFEKLEPPYFLFSSEYTDLSDYWKVSEDFYFMLKLQDAGIKVTYAPHISVGHLGYAVVFGQNDVTFI